MSVDSSSRSRLLPSVARRQLLRGSFAVAAATGGVAAAGRTAAVGSQSLPAWSDPATWGTAGVPRPGAAVVLDFPVRLDQDIQVASLHVECGGHVVLDPDRSVTIRSTGNVEVCGILEMRPARPDVQHLLRFEGIEESRFVGGGMAVVPTDVGLWIHGDGQLDLHGTPRTAWVRAAGALAPGSRTIRLQAQPVGWRVGDELVVTPTGSPVDKRQAERFDEAVITAITGNVVTLQTGLRFGHPAVAVGDGHVLTAEVLNLTRNVRIEGTPEGRTHTMAMHVTRPSQVRYAAFRHFGPRQTDGKYTEKVLGRYGFHFHMCQDGSRGSTLEGVVMRDGGSHAYVPHLSHGVTVRSCVSYDTVETAYWWDLPADTRAAADESHDVVFDSCVAAKVATIPAFRGFRLAGFQLGAGVGSSAVDCVATGVHGTKDSSGFTWPEGSQGIWKFQGCVTHNNARHGTFTWQNSPNSHVVERFVSYHNGGHGVAHGAYRNGYVYRDAILYGNAEGGVLLHAVSRDDSQLKLVNLLVDGAGLSAGAIVLGNHQIDTTNRTIISGCRLRGYRQAGIIASGTSDGSPAEVVDLVDVLDCTFSGNRLWLSTTVRKDSQLRITTPNGPLVVRPRSSGTGRLRRAWNARSQRLRTFPEYTRTERVPLVLRSGADA